jgi:hypothetical protein
LKRVVRQRAKVQIESSKSGAAVKSAAGPQVQGHSRDAGHPGKNDKDAAGGSDEKPVPDAAGMRRLIRSLAAIQAGPRGSLEQRRIGGLRARPLVSSVLAPRRKLEEKRNRGDSVAPAHITSARPSTPVQRRQPA